MTAASIANARRGKSRVGQKLLKQHEVPVLGGAMSLIRAVTFYISAINFVMVSRVFWDSSTLTRDIFMQSYWVFLLGLGAILLVAMLMEYKLVLPSMLKFQQYQSYRVERSPIYIEVVELRRQLAKEVVKLGEQLAEVQRALKEMREAKQ